MGVGVGLGGCKALRLGNGGDDHPPMSRLKEVQLTDSHAGGTGLTPKIPIG